VSVLVARDTYTKHINTPHKYFQVIFSEVVKSFNGERIRFSA
jgi:hypothetical protein